MSAKKLHILQLFFDLMFYVYYTFTMFLGIDLLIFTMYVFSNTLQGLYSINPVSLVVLM